MAELRDLAVGLGFGRVRTWLQSGNLVFSDDGKSPGEIEATLGRAIEERLSLKVDVVVRSASELAGVIRSNPFATAAESDPSHLLVMFLKATPLQEKLEALRDSIRGPELIEAQGHHLYLVYPAGIGTSKLTNAVIESKLGVRGTARNWNTVLKLADLGGAATD